MCKNQQIYAVNKKNVQICSWHKHYYILYLYVPRIRFYVNFYENGSKKIGANFKKNFSAILGTQVQRIRNTYT
uniref:Uncharacterized protein n=1 Tax=Siphoviridae sp. ct2vX3 TaxID=2825318 RepID=A0A8S5PY06_9CAUD|nr:MAG TPA: hypothetical protein [Siphoviridae sp. ct2vX3]